VTLKQSARDQLKGHVHTAHFWVVGQEYGAGQAAGDAADDVDEPEARPADELFDVSHDEHLETDRDEQRNQPASHMRTAGESQ